MHLQAVLCVQNHCCLMGHGFEITKMIGLKEALREALILFRFLNSNVLLALAIMMLKKKAARK